MATHIICLLCVHIKAFGQVLCWPMIICKLYGSVTITGKLIVIKLFDAAAPWALLRWYYPVIQIRNDIRLAYNVISRWNLTIFFVVTSLPRSQTKHTIREQCEWLCTKEEISLYYYTHVLVKETPDVWPVFRCFHHLLYNISLILQHIYNSNNLSRLCEPFQLCHLISGNEKKSLIAE